MPRAGLPHTLGRVPATDERSVDARSINQSACDPDFVGTRCPRENPREIPCFERRCRRPRPCRHSCGRPLWGMGKRIREASETAQAACRHRRQADPVEHHEGVLPLRLPSLHGPAGVWERPDQAVRPGLPKALQRLHAAPRRRSGAAFSGGDPVEDWEITFGHRTHDWHRPNRCGSS